MSIDVEVVVLAPKASDHWASVAQLFKVNGKRDGYVDEASSSSHEGVYQACVVATKVVTNLYLQCVYNWILMHCPS